MYNLVFGVGVYEEETCFEQVSLNSFTSLETLRIHLFLFAHLKLTFVTTYLCKFRFGKSFFVFKHLRCLWKRWKPLFLCGQSMKDNFQQLLSWLKQF